MPNPISVCDLTLRQRQVLEARAEGLKREAVAAKLGITVHTVDLHTSQAYRKLGVHCLVEAILAYRGTAQVAA